MYLLSELLNCTLNDFTHHVLHMLSCSLTCRGTEHQSQSDAFFIAPRLFASLVGKTSALDIHTTHRINQEICHAFLRRHLLNGKSIGHIIKMNRTLAIL